MGKDEGMGKGRGQGKGEGEGQWYRKRRPQRSLFSSDTSSFNSNINTT